MNREKQLWMRAVVHECLAAVRDATEAILTDDQNVFNAYAKSVNKSIHRALEAQIKASVAPYEKTSESETP